MRTITNQPDYIAIILIGGGSAWGRSPDKETAIKNAITALRDWQVYYDLSGVEVTLNIIDAQGYNETSWGGERHIQGKSLATGKWEAIKRQIEHVKRTTPKWKPRKRSA